MKRADRLEPVQQVLNDAERKLAEHLAAAEKLLAHCQQKLEELTAYRDDYTQGFARRAGGGMGARELADYQAFMARLNQAIEHQRQAVQRAYQDQEMHQRRWQDAAQRAKALGNVIERWHQDARRAADRREQRETDERAQRRRVVSH